MRAAVIVFPGSNCDRDVAVALRRATGRDPAMVWHRETDLPPSDLIVLPGGFSYGDYLRAGAIAAHSPILRAVRERAQAGIRVLGICNGFQMLTEAGLLPGALLPNRSLRFVSRLVALRVERADTPFTAGYRAGQVIRIPVAHMDGNYVADPDVLARLEGNGQVAFRYVADAEGGAARSEAGAPANPNGAQNDIAGVFDARRTVLGLMPHPERAIDPGHASRDGRALFDGLVDALVAA